MGHEIVEEFLILQNVFFTIVLCSESVHLHPPKTKGMYQHIVATLIEGKASLGQFIEQVANTF